MANNKISIEVEVKFPTVKDLQEKLAEKWKSVKDGFEGKINIDIDGHSINKAKKKIQDALDAEPFNVKLNVDFRESLEGLNRFHAEIKKLDEDLKRVREFKVNFNISTEMERMANELAEAQRKAESSFDSQTLAMKEQTNQYDKQIDRASKLQMIMKQMADGSYATTVKATENLPNGEKVVLTHTPDGRKHIEELYDREKALKVVHDIMNDIHALDVKQINASKDTSDIMEREKGILLEQLKTLREQYHTRYQMDALDEDSTQELMREQAVTKELKEQAHLEKLIKEEQSNRANAIKEIEGYLKRVHRIELDLIGAKGKQKEELDKQLADEKKILEELKTQFYIKNKINGLSADSTQELIRIHDMNKALKEQALLDKKIAKDAKDLEQAIARNAQLEKTKLDIAKQMITASEGERQVLGDQFNFYDRIQNQLEQKWQLQQNMTSEQREELANLQRISFLEEEKIRAKQRQREEESRLSQEQRERQQEERQALNEVLSDLRRIHQLRQQIASLEQRVANGGKLSASEGAKLAMMKAESKELGQQLNNMMRYYQSQNLVTDEMRRQIDAYQEMQRNEMRRIEASERAGAQESAKQDEINAKLKEYQTIQRNINQLRRDLIYAGMREEAVIESEIKKQQTILSDLHAELRAVNAITDAREKEIQALERINQEQMKVNRNRQDAREKDQAFNDTGGLIDPYSTFAHFEQGAHAILEPIARIDEALIGVEKVASATEEQFREFAETSFDVASQLGVSADEYILAVEKWVTAGKTFKESKELAETSLIGSFVGNISPDDMVKYMSVPMEAFKDTGLEATDVINSMNEVANKNAIEMADLGKAYQRSATTAKDAGVSFGELTGMITAAQEQTRKGGEKIGTGIKTISANLLAIQSQFKKDNKTKFSYLESLGLDLKNDDGSVKSLTEIIGQLSALKGKLSKTEFSNALTMLAGKEHLETMSAIVAQYHTLEKVKKEVEGQNNLGKEGSAYLEHAKQADSVKFKLAELKNAWDELMFTIGGGRDGVADVLTVLIEGLEELNNLASNEQFMNTLKYIFAGIAIHAGANLYRRFFDTVMTGFGGMIQRGKESKRMFEDLFLAKKKAMGNDGDGGSRNPSDSNGSDGGTTTVVGGVGSRTGRKEPEADMSKAHKESMDTLNGKVGESARLLGKVAGFLPIIGETLLVLDLLGVPVFEKMGQMIDDATTDAKELNEELDKANKGFLAKNQIMNGNTTNYSNELEGTKNEKTGLREGGIRQELEEGLSSDGYLTEEEFVKVRDRFNKLAEEANIDVKIDMNNIDHIYEAIAKLTSGLNGLKESEIAGVGAQYEEQVNNVMEANKAIAEDNAKIDYLKKERDEYQNVIDKMNEKVQKGGELSDSEKLQLSEAQAYVASYSSSITTLEKDIEGRNKIIENANKNMGKYSEELVHYIANGGKLTGMTESQTITAITPMIDNYNKLTGELNGVKDATKAVNGANKLTQSQWDALIKTYPDLKTISLDEINKNKEKRESVKKTISEKQKEKEATQKATYEAIQGASKHIGMEDQVKGKLGEVITTTGQLKKKIDEKNKAIDNTKKEVTTTWNFKVKEWAKGIWKWITGGGGKSSESTHTVNVKKKEESQSVSIGGNTGVTSASISANGVNGSIIGNPTSVTSLAKATDKREDPDANARVSSSIWRYGDTENSLSKLENALKRLTDAIRDAEDNQDKLIQLYKEQQGVLKQQMGTNRTLRSQKESEMDETLRNLKKYGFNVNTTTNDIGNLSHARNLKGKSAKEAEELLNTWKSLYSEIESLGTKIEDIDSQIGDLQKKIEEAQIAKEFKTFEATLKRIDALLTSVNNSDNLIGKRLDLIGGNDKEQELIETEKAMNASKKNMSSLIAEFNKLSASTINHKENGEKLQAHLQRLSTEILSQSDAIIKYQQALNDLEINRVVEDMGKFNTAIDDNTDKIKNNIENLKEGLLSGTDIGDLQSSIASELDLNRDNQYEKLAKERLALEEEMQQALDTFAKKNVERAKNVANAELDITAQKYNEMLRMQSEYSAGNKSSAISITEQYDDLSNIGSADEDYTLVDKLDDSYDAIVKKQEDLTKKFEEDMAKATNQEKRDELTNQYIIDNLKVQEEYFKASIESNKQAIAELKEQLNDPSLTDEQENKIKQQIASYEKEITDAQNNIKDTIKERFEFEFSLLDKAVEQYDKFASELEYALDIVDALGGENFDAKGVLLQELADVEKSRNAELKESLESLEKQMALYEEGSYEWNLLNTEAEAYKKSLQDSNKELLEMNKNILSNSFDSATNSLERTMFGGKTLDQYKEYQELWMDGLEREIALEEAYQRMADLGTDMYKQKLQLLEKQDKLSKFEMDYLNKQLDVLELQQKLENLSKEKTVQTLKRKADGTWDWQYEGDAVQIAETQEELAQKQLELQQLEEQGREDYLSKLDGILKDAEDGNYDNIEDFRKALDDLGHAYGTIVGDIPQIKEEYLKQLVDAYAKYMNDNGSIGVTSKSVSAYTGYSHEAVQTFGDIGNNIAQVLVDVLTAKLPNFSQLTGKDAMQNIEIHLEKIEFPNITSPDGIKDAILSLPQIALQKAKEKL